MVPEPDPGTILAVARRRLTISRTTGATIAHELERAEPVKNLSARVLQGTRRLMEQSHEGRSAMRPAGSFIAGKSRSIASADYRVFLTFESRAARHRASAAPFGQSADDHDMIAGQVGRRLPVRPKSRKTTTAKRFSERTCRRISFGASVANLRRKRAAAWPLA
jgi:hypothetical protein